MADDLIDDLLNEAQFIRHPGVKEWVDVSF